MPTTAADVEVKDYTLTLDGTAKNWSSGTWTSGGIAVPAPTLARNVEIVATASTALTIDSAVKVSQLTISGTGASVVTISNGSGGSLSVGEVVVASGILKPNGTPSTSMKLRVQDGGAIDLASAAASGYYVKIAGQGVLKDGVYTGALFSSANISGGAAQLRGITLSANATIRCDYNWGIIRSSYDSGTLSLGGYTLTKVGSANFWICNVTDSASGNIVVSEGNFATIKTKSTFSNATLTIGDGATLRMDTPDGGGATDLEVKNLVCDAGSTVNIAAARTLKVTTALTANGTMKPLGTVTCNGSMTIGGDVVVPSDKTWTVAGTLTVADGGKLEIKNNALVPGALALADGGTLKIANVSDAAHKVTAGTVTFPASGAAIIDVSDIPDLDENDEVDVLTGNTSLPSDVSTLKIVGKQCSLESESNTLKVVNDGGLVWDGEWTTGKDPTKYGDAIIASSGTVALGGTSLSFNSVTLSGSGTVSFSATGSETVSIKNLEIGAGVTLTANAALDLTGCTITGDGTLDIPVGTTYAMDGVTCSAKVTVEGTLETSGTTTLSGANTSASGSLIKIVSDTTTLASAVAGLSGDITIESGAVLTVGAAWANSQNYMFDHINPNGNSTITVHGTVNFGEANMWEFGGNIKIKLYTGAVLNGNNSDAYGGTLDWYGNGMVNVYGNASINCKIRTSTGANPTFDVDEGATLTISKDFVPQAQEITYYYQSNSSGGSFTKAGAGTLKFTQETLTKPITISAGKVQLKRAFSSGLAISIAEGAELELGVGMGSTDVNVTGTSFAGVTGNGTIRYSSQHSGYYTQPISAANMFATTLHVANDNAGKGVVIPWSGGVTTNRTISGSGKYRTDWSGSSGVADRYFLALQDANSEWSGIFHENDRMHGMKVAGVEGAANKTLTLSGTQTQTNTLEVEPTGSVNLTGSWIGDTTVYGEFGGTGSLTGALTFNAGSTFKVWEIGGLSVTGGVTFAESGVTVDVSDLTIGREDSTVLLTATSGSNFPAVGNFTLTGSSTHVLSKTGQKEWSLLPIIATYSRNDGSGIVTPYADSVDVAINALVTQKATYPNAYVTVFIGAPSYYTAELLASNGIALDAETGNYVIAEAKIDDTLYPTIEAAIANAGENDTVVLARDISRTEIAVNKEVEFSEGDYTFTGSFTGNGTLALPDGTLLKSPSSDRWASGWTGTVWLRNYTSLTGSSKQGGTPTGTTSFEPNNYGNSNSTVRFTGVKGYLTANDDGSYTVQPALELVDDGDTPGLLLYNGWGYNSNVQCYTSIRELKGSGTLKADPTIVNGSIPGLNVLLQVCKWDNFTGTLNMPNKNVSFGATLPAQSEVEGGGHIVVQSGASVEVPAGKTWTVGSGVVVYGNLSLGTGAAIVNTTAANTWIKCGTGKVTLNALGDLPATPASNWAGTVVIPAHTTNTALELNDYGVAGSTVEIPGMSDGWLKAPDSGAVVINPNLRLTGTMLLDDMSAREYRFQTISGNGSLQVTDSDCTSVSIAKIAAEFEGSITNTSGQPMTITEVDLAAAPSIPSKVLTTSGTKITVTSVTVDGTPTYPSGATVVVSKDDGVYVVRTGTIFSVY